MLVLITDLVDCSPFHPQLREGFAVVQIPEQQHASLGVDVTVDFPLVQEVECQALDAGMKLHGFQHSGTCEMRHERNPPVVEALSWSFVLFAPDHHDPETPPLLVPTPPLLCQSPYLPFSIYSFLFMN